MHGAGMGAGLNEGNIRERSGGGGLMNQDLGGGRPMMGNFGNQEQQGGGRPMANFGNQPQGGIRSGQDFENRRDGEVGRRENQAWRGGGGGREAEAFSRRREDDDRGGRWGGGGDSRKGFDQPRNDWNASDQRHPGRGDFEGRSGRREEFEGRKGEFEGRREQFEGGRGGGDSSFRWLSQDSALI